MQEINGYKINIERFANILAKRWKRNHAYEAKDLPELKKLSGSYPMPGPGRDAINVAVERRAYEISQNRKITWCPNCPSELWFDWSSCTWSCTDCGYKPLPQNVVLGTSGETR